MKTHNKTGLKYLGKTEQDPYKYRGSGSYWKSHLKKHGNDVNTTILKEYDSNEEVKEWGLYYSQLWDVVNSDQWANLMEEKGDGVSGDQAKKIWENNEHRLKMSIESSLRWQDPIHRKKVSEKNSELTKKQWEDPKFRELISEKTKIQSKKQWEDPLYRETMVEKFSERTKKMWNNPVYKKVKTDQAKKKWNDTEYRNMMTELSKDKNIYHFIHKDGKEEKCTQYDLRIKYNLNNGHLSSLVHGNLSQHKGWRIVKNENQ